MVSTTHLVMREKILKITPYHGHITHCVDAQWELRFKQCKLTTKDQVIQINLGDDKYPKPIFMSKNLSSEELNDLI